MFLGLKIQIRGRCPNPTERVYILAGYGSQFAATRGIKGKRKSRGMEKRRKRRRPRTGERIGQGKKESEIERGRTGSTGEREEL